jgi:hypothetical protein
MRMLASAFDTADCADAVEAVVLLDDDDEDSLALTFDRLSVIRLVRGPMSMGSRTLACIEAATGDIFVLTNDDVIVQTKGWDSAIRAAAASFKDGVYLFYPNDWFKGAVLPTFPILSRRLVSTGVLNAWQAYKGAFLDVHIFEIFQRLRRSEHDRIRYLDDVVFEHLHYRTGKSPWDDTYARRERFGDDDTFAALASHRRAAADSLRRYIEGAALEVPSAVRGPPASVWGLAYSLRLIFDRGLPTPWRIRVAFWFAGRQAYRRTLAIVGAPTAGARRAVVHTQRD